MVTNIAKSSRRTEIPLSKHSVALNINNIIINIFKVRKLLRIFFINIPPHFIENYIYL